MSGTVMERLRALKNNPEADKGAGQTRGQGPV